MNDMGWIILAVLWLGTMGLLVGYALFRAKFSAEQAKYREMSRRAAQKQKPQARGESAGQMEGTPEWLIEVADQLGLGEYLDQEEMPAELEKLLPLAKGFIDSGGLQRILGAGGKAGSTGPEASGEGWH